jgi:putative transposase
MSTFRIAEVAQRSGLATVDAKITDAHTQIADLATLAAKYCPTFPKRFAGIDHARWFCDVFFHHYNHRHRHSGIGLHTPADVHHGRAPAIRALRQAVLDAAYATRPERFRQPPAAPGSPTRHGSTHPRRRP